MFKILKKLKSVDKTETVSEQRYYTVVTLSKISTDMRYPTSQSPLFQTHKYTTLSGSPTNAQNCQRDALLLTLLKDLLRRDQTLESDLRVV